MMFATESLQETGDRPGFFYLPPGSHDVSEISEKEYREIMSSFQNQWQAEVLEKTGKPLLVKPEWENPYFAAYAVDRTQYWEIALWGGMARAREATSLHLKTILCHELGHIIGGEPRQTLSGAEWSSTEGQSDFFAAKECLSKVLSAQDVEGVDLSSAQAICDGHVQCLMVVAAGWKAVLFFQRFQYLEIPSVDLFKPEGAVSVFKPNTYPSYQCRLDTYIQGARCLKDVTFCSPPICWMPPSVDKLQKSQ